MNQCQRCQRVVKRNQKSQIMVHRCINALSEHHGQIVTTDVCAVCNSKIHLQERYKQRKIDDIRKKSIPLSLEKISETAKEAARQAMEGVPKKERCC